MSKETSCESILKLIIDAERDAGKIILEAQNVLAEEKTSKRDLVTKYDCKVQDFLIERLKESMPDACFYCEEQGKTANLNAECLFIIDPIDGTMNFIRKFHHSCISIAYAKKGELLCSAIYNPYTDEMYTSIKNGGAFLNNKPIYASNEPLNNTIVCFGTSPYNTELSSKCLSLTEKVFNLCLDIRRLGSAALDICYVAAGRAGLYYEFELSPWDYCAGILIAREAGCECCTLDGDMLKLENKPSSLVVGGKTAVKEFLLLFKSMNKK